jgi:hypothetical protein
MTRTVTVTEAETESFTCLEIIINHNSLQRQSFCNCISARNIAIASWRAIDSFYSSPRNGTLKPMVELRGRAVTIAFAIVYQHVTLLLRAGEQSIPYYSSPRNGTLKPMVELRGRAVTIAFAIVYQHVTLLLRAGEQSIPYYSSPRNGTLKPMVELRGLEPLTPGLQSRCSPN